MPTDANSATSGRPTGASLVASRAIDNPSAAATSHDAASATDKADVAAPDNAAHSDGSASSKLDVTRTRHATATVTLAHANGTSLSGRPRVLSAASKH